ncbi:MAG TPA: hypothetical protein VLE95_03640 [Chlamydiales bacterium]|nr:hypothetical protein [Chlamydiales bacterium]
MTSSINQNVTKPSEPVVVSNTRMVVSTLAGASIGTLFSGCLAHSQEISASFKTMTSWVVDALPRVSNTLKDFASPAVQLATSAIFSNVGGPLIVAGIVLGALYGEVTAPANLTQVKKLLNIPTSDLTMNQIKQIADIKRNWGVFTPSTSAAEEKSDAVRIKNLNNILKKTEASLSSNARAISEARANEDRFFHFEGARLANQSGWQEKLSGWSTQQCIETLSALKSAIDSEVNATDKYTYQQGNSQTSVSRRSYILNEILRFAYQEKIAGAYLSSAILERARTEDVKEADEGFSQTVQRGIAEGILNPGPDGNLYDGMVEAACVASLSSREKNPDSSISSFFNLMKNAGLVDDTLFARFVADVRKNLIDSGAKIVDPVTPKKPSLIDKIGNLFSRSSIRQGGNELPGLHNATPALGNNSETAKERADADVNVFATKLASLEFMQTELISHYEKLIQLLNEKHQSLSTVLRMGKGRLRASIWAVFKDDLKPLEHFEDKDPEIKEIREEIAGLENQLDRISISNDRPSNFKLASEQQRKAAEQIEKQFQNVREKIVHLSAQAASIDQSIQRDVAVFQKGASKLTRDRFPATEKTLIEPNVPKQPSFFENLFKKSAQTAVDNQGLIESGIASDPVANSEDDAIRSLVEAGQDEEALIAPVVIQPKHWFW